jgi:hypothetical protein
VDSNIVLEKEGSLNGNDSSKYILKSRHELGNDGEERWLLRSEYRTKIFFSKISLESYSRKKRDHRFPGPPAFSNIQSFSSLFSN